MAKKIIKKKVVARAKSKAKKATVKVLLKAEKREMIGVVTHFYTAIKVAIVKLKKPLKRGETIIFKGATTDFTQPVQSMQYDHNDIPAGKLKQEIGMKVRRRVREGDEVFRA